MKILCITGKKGRVQHARMELLKRHIPFKYDICPVGGKIPKSKYDLIYYTHFSLVSAHPYKGRKIASITSHKSIDEMSKTLEILRKFEGVSVNNTMLFKKFTSRVPKLHYTPNGVDCDFFSFKKKNKSSKPVVGWVGNKDRATKNFRSIFKVLKKNYGRCEFKAVATSKKDSSKKLRSPEKMREYYHSLDFFIVCSSTEGTPNPALEAMACGVPVITTRVGNMIEIIKDGENGFFVKDKVKSFRKKLDQVLTLEEDKYQALRYKTRDCIEPWDWSIKSQAWIDFWECHCG